MPHSTAVEGYSFQQYGLAPGQNPFLQQPNHQTLQQHGVQHHPQMVSVTAVETHPTLRQSQHLLRRQQQMPHHQPSYGAGSSSATATYQPEYGPGHSRKRSRANREELQLDVQGLSGLQDITSTPSTDVPIELTPHGHHAQPQSQLYQPTTHQQTLAAQPQHHHHHRLPNQPPPSKMRRLGPYGEPSSPPAQHGPPSVVGQEGMPPPAPRPRGPKLKFTPEDDQLLVDLKEKKNLTWKQIADFFPGRSSGTLQVRYCTKLKAKTTVWTDEMVSLFPSHCFFHGSNFIALGAFRAAMRCNARRLASMLSRLCSPALWPHNVGSCSVWSALLSLCRNRRLRVSHMTRANEA